ncbi:AIPR family protein [Pedococcus ginsenosidimutans]|uniref:AIPR family protein n=1 Tax=Pedococcus ginsenosidimutans TaxID=490570 RepID=A0ABP8Y0F7_9MICO
MSEFREELLNMVATRAEVDSDYMVTAFTNEVAERLSDAGEVENLVAMHFRGVGGNGRKNVGVDAFDTSDSDDSISLAVTLFEGSDEPETLTQSDANTQFAMLKGYLYDAVHGTFKQGREASEPAVHVAEDLRMRARSVTKYRLFLLTDRVLSSRAKHLPSDEINEVPVDFHVWDIERLEQLARSSSGRTELDLDLRKWAPDGLDALRVPGDEEFDTYLAVVPGPMLADLYAEHGSRLLESNVRSFLSARGKVNKGIRTTVQSRPEKFLAFNNGITATATSVELTEEGAIRRIKDLQIVNGGQTTASLFYIRRDSSPKPDLNKIHVQMKLVVVQPDEAEALVPDISRFANSQNAVSEADFFSNSPFHVRMENLSRRTLAPSRPGTPHQTYWFYERTRGQYLNEKNKGTPAVAKKFEASFPRNQVITKTDAARYLVAWDGKPHVVSQGAQKNFVAFAQSVTAKWEVSDAQFNAAYFKELAAKAILYNALRARVSKAEWYDKGYLANIVTYAMAKVAYDLQRSKRGVMNFPAIWQQQSAPEHVLEYALNVAHMCFHTLTAPGRPVQNVTEWAKREQCWEAVRAQTVPLPSEVQDWLLSVDVVMDEKRDATRVQRIDNGIEAQTAVFQVSASEWSSMEQFLASNRLLSPSEQSVLGLMTGRRPGVPSEKQAAWLLKIREKATAHGFH